jgi:hypothetical protein
LSQGFIMKVRAVVTKAHRAPTTQRPLSLKFSQSIIESIKRSLILSLTELKTSQALAITPPMRELKKLLWCMAQQSIIRKESFQNLLSSIMPQEMRLANSSQTTQSRSLSIKPRKSTLTRPLPWHIPKLPRSGFSKTSLKGNIPIPSVLISSWVKIVSVLIYLRVLVPNVMKPQMDIISRPPL